MLSREKGFRELHKKILWVKEGFLISLAKLRMDDISFLMDGWIDEWMDDVSSLYIQNFFKFFKFFPGYVKLKSFLSQEEL
jgi:hypothetical protein